MDRLFVLLLREPWRRDKDDRHRYLLFKSGTARLLARPALERRPDPDDLRSKRITLTPRGASAVHVIREAVGEVETAWAQQLGPKRFAQLRSLLLDLSQPT